MKGLGALLTRRVAGVPVFVLFGGGVLITAYLLHRRKAAAGSSTSSGPGSSQLAGTADLTGGQPDTGGLGGGGFGGFDSGSSGSVGGSGLPVTVPTGSDATMDVGQPAAGSVTDNPVTPPPAASSTNPAAASHPHPRPATPGHHPRKPHPRRKTTHHAEPKHRTRAVHPVKRTHAEAVTHRRVEPAPITRARRHPKASEQHKIEAAQRRKHERLDREADRR